MITVSIFINGNPIVTRSAVNQLKDTLKGEATYKVDDGSIILHKRSKGAIPLAIKLLKLIKKI